MYRIRVITNYILIAIGIGSSCFVHAQTPALDTLTTSTQNDSLDTNRVSLSAALIRSAIVPGWGQIYQEHPGRAVTFYGLSLTFLYHAAFNYHWWDKTGDQKYKIRFINQLRRFAQVYALNLIDVIGSHLHGENQPWKGEMFSDKPLKSPWGAVARSAMLPGWGQIYNQEYLKAAITFAVCFDFARKAYVNNLKYHRTNKNAYREWRSTNSWYFGLAYFLTMVDAFVDAYLYKFDETLELTFIMTPVDKTLTVGVLIEF